MPPPPSRATPRRKSKHSLPALAFGGREVLRIGQRQRRAEMLWQQQRFVGGAGPQRQQGELLLLRRIQSHRHAIHRPSHLTPFGTRQGLRLGQQIVVRIETGVGGGPDETVIEAEQLMQQGGPRTPVSQHKQRWGQGHRIAARPGGGLLHGLEGGKQWSGDKALPSDPSSAARLPVLAKTTPGAEVEIEEASRSGHVCVSEVLSNPGMSRNRGDR